MIYTSYDFITLEQKNDDELIIELEQAKDNYEYVQALFSEGDNLSPFEQGKNIPLDILFSHLNNIEQYIRKIENLRNGYEEDLLRVRQAIRRRNKRLNRKTLNII